MNKTLKNLILICVLYLAACMVLFPTECMDAARNAVGLCLDVVIPSLFPFFVCSSLFVGLGLAAVSSRFLSPVMRPLFGVPGSGALALVLGIVSGYPVGAKCAVDLYRAGSVTKKEAERLTAFCNNSGPLFILGAVGVGMLSNPQLGALLYVSHILSAFLVGLVFRFYRGEKEPGLPELPPALEDRPSSLGGVIGGAVGGSVETILKVCGFVIVFSVFARALPQFAGSGLIYALLEITGGVKSVLGMELSGALRLALASLFIAFSGLSVLLQVASIITPCGLSLKPYLTGKSLQGLLSFCITLLLLRVLPISVDVFAPAVTAQPFVTSVGQLFKVSLMMALWCGLSILIMIVIAWVYDRIKRK